MALKYRPQSIPDVPLNLILSFRKIVSSNEIQEFDQLSVPDEALRAQFYLILLIEAFSERSWPSSRLLCVLNTLKCF